METCNDKFYEEEVCSGCYSLQLHYSSYGYITNIQIIFFPRFCSETGNIEIFFPNNRRCYLISLLGSGGLVIWGQGDAGQLGNGETKSSGEGVKLVALKKGVVLAATGEQHTVAAKGIHCIMLPTFIEKGVFSWGNGADGRLGHGDETTQLQPVPIQLFNTKKILSVACGAEHSAVIVEGAILYTWGKGQYGRLGHGDDKNQLSPKVVETLSSKTPKEVACGSDWTTVITANGVYSFGSGANGRLGIGNDHAQTLPTLVEGLNGLKIAQLTCGHHHTLVLTEAGQVFSYGYGGNGRLGHGNEADEKRPKEIEALKGKGVVFVAGGAYHSAAINGEAILALPA